MQSQGPWGGGPIPRLRVQPGPEPTESRRGLTRGSRPVYGSRPDLTGVLGPEKVLGNPDLGWDRRGHRGVPGRV